MAVNAASAYPKVEIVTVTRGDAYIAQLRRWSESAEKKAKFIALPKSAGEIAQTVCCLVTLGDIRLNPLFVPRSGLPRLTILTLLLSAVVTRFTGHPPQMTSLLTLRT